MRLRFSEFVFDADSRRLTRGGEAVHLEPKAFELLELLLEKRPAAVAKSAIRDRLWPRTFVSESSLTTLAAQLRRALGEEDRLIRTVHGFGYAFDGEAAALDAPTPAPPAASGRAGGPCLVWLDQVFALAEGETLSPGSWWTCRVSPGVTRGSSSPAARPWSTTWGARTARSWETAASGARRLSPIATGCGSGTRSSCSGVRARRDRPRPSCPE
jgi:DNA-binding winged helix-turn-helix (wHTH) protein